MIKKTQKMIKKLKKFKIKKEAKGVAWLFS